MPLHENKYLIIVVIICVIVAGIPHNIYADAGPTGTEWAIIEVAGIVIVLAVITLGIYLLYRHSTTAPISAVMFDSEDVSITIEKGEMKVDASFEYLNTADKRLRMDLYFPFASHVKDTISDLSIVLVDRDTSSEEQVEYTSKENRIYFDFPIGPKERKLLKVHYRETIRGSHAEYILTTIRQWQLPVAKATFTVELPSNCVNPRFSFKESLVEKISPEGASYALYKFVMRDLFPEKEFQVDWQ
jgi:hypothetical protein